MSGLPQELIDHIIDHVNDRETLKACSLVCSQWSPRSRKYLFAHVDFTLGDLQLWCARIRPGPSGPSSLVEVLTISEYCPSSTSFSPIWIRSSILTDAASHFRSFSALRALEVCRWPSMNADCTLSMLQSFGSSLENVTRLTMEEVTIHPSILAMFVGHFPSLDNLSISVIKILRTLEGADDLYPGFRGEIIPTHPRGKFSVSSLLGYQVPKGVFEAIVLLEPRFHQVSLANVGYYAWRDYWPLVEACAESLEELRILANVIAQDADFDGLSLACCPRLRKIIFSLGSKPCKFVEKCLSTITSTQLSEVSLRFLTGMPDFGPPFSNPTLWGPLDIILCNLAGKYRPRYEGDRMLVELVDVNPDPSGAKNSFWRYRERGSLRVNSAAYVEPSEW